jgi:uncharacterized DUF497 family protein
VEIDYDPDKRAWTLRERGLDFEHAKEVFAANHLTRIDDRIDYGEERFATAGRLDGRIVLVVWTPRGELRRIISMRKANERESKKLAPHLG